MELEELKSKLNVSDVRYSTSELNEIFEVRTKHAVSKINQKMWFDAILMIFTAVTLIAATFLIGLQDRYLISSEIIILSMVLLLHYRIKYHLLNRINFEEAFNKALKKVSHRLTIYMTVYVILIPLGVGILYLNIQWKLITILQPELLEKWLRFGFVAPLAAAIYLLTREADLPDLRA